MTTPVRRFVAHVLSAAALQVCDPAPLFVRAESYDLLLQSEPGSRRRFGPADARHRAAYVSTPSTSRAADV